jgi:amylosucrase
VRCHDDIGWAIGDEDAAAVGYDGHAHREFLSDYYSGAFPGSDARGLVFQENPINGDRRISGTAASLAGLEVALAEQDPRLVDLAVRRLLVAHLVVLGFGGLPLLYMGDELALLNDYGYLDDPEHADDNRWVHRPRMPWDAVDRRNTRGTLEHRVWQTLRAAVRARAALVSMHAAIEADLLDSANPAVFAFARRHPAQTLVALNNVTEQHQWWPRENVPLDGPLRDALSDEPPSEDEDGLRLAPYEARWLVQRQP